MTPLGRDIDLAELMTMEIVSASRVPQTLAEAPSNIETVNAQQIREWGCRDLKDVLRRVANFPVIPDRDEWVFGARGNVIDNNIAYLILIDGHRVNSIENFGPGQIIELPNDLSNVKRIEIIRGPGSAVWGSDALAGVINIVTKDVEDLGGDLVRATATWGQDGMYRGNAQLGYKLGLDTEIMLSGSFSAQQGRLVRQSAATTLPILEKDSATNFGDHPYGTYITALDRREPGYMLHAKARVGKLFLNAVSFYTSVYNRHFEADQGRSVYLRTAIQYLEAGYTTRIGNSATLTTRVSSDLHRAEYLPTEQGDASQFPFNITWYDQGARMSADVNAPFHRLLSLNGGLDYAPTRLGPNQRIDGFDADNPKAKKSGYWIDRAGWDHAAGGYLQATVAPQGPLALTLGGRFDINNARSATHTNLNPRASLIWRPQQTTALKLIYNRGFLRPSNFQIADAMIKPEVMDQGEFVALQRFGRFNLSATAFWQRLRGFVAILNGFERRNEFGNAGDYTSKGAEASISWHRLDDTVWANGSYTLANVENFPAELDFNSRRALPNGRALSFPGVTANAGATLRYLNRRLFVTPMVRFTGKVHVRLTPPTLESLEDAQYGTVGPFGYFDLSAGYTVNSNLALYVYGDNLFDVRANRELSIWNGGIGQYGRYVEARAEIRY